MNVRHTRKRRIEQDGKDDADRALHKIIGNGRCGGKSLAEDQRLIAEVARDHDQLRRQLQKRQLPERGLLALPQKRPHQKRGDQRDEALDDERAGNIVRIAAQQIDQRTADARSREAVPRPENQSGQQAHAVAKIGIAAHGRDLNDSGHNIGQRRQQGGKNELIDLISFHSIPPQGIPCFFFWDMLVS